MTYDEKLRDIEKTLNVFCAYVVTRSLVERYRELYMETGDTVYLHAEANATDWIGRESWGA